jgi:hypothetical protein
MTDFKCSNEPRVGHTTCAEQLLPPPPSKNIHPGAGSSVAYTIELIRSLDTLQARPHLEPHLYPSTCDTATTTLVPLSYQNLSATVEFSNHAATAQLERANALPKCGPHV